MPKLRINSEGERIRIGDPIQLEHVTSHLKLSVDRLGSKLPCGR